MDADGPAERFVETKEGELFFLNLVLAAPALVVLWPLLMGRLLRALGALDGPSRLWDPVPMVAAHAGPWIAWLSVVPLALAVKNLRMELPVAARRTLRALVVLHLAVLAWWVAALLG